MRRFVAALVSMPAALLCFAVGRSAAGNRWISALPLNIAHQGGEDEFPSNTMYAFRDARRAGDARRCRREDG
ncbi:MAG TPA: hypothetical protein VK307_09290 [Thermoleophilaceae bacterium]|nr:hypothetical protein [Thermoleophilaceae bacterium]